MSASGDTWLTGTPLCEESEQTDCKPHNTKYKPLAGMWSGSRGAGSRGVRPRRWRLAPARPPVAPAARGHPGSAGRDRFPRPRAHRGVAGIDDAVDDEAVREGLGGLDPPGEAVHEVAHLLAEAIRPGFFRNGEHPSGLRVSLLDEITGRVLDEPPYRRGRGVGDQAARGAHELVP